MGGAKAITEGGGAAMTPLPINRGVIAAFAAAAAAIRASSSATLAAASASASFSLARCVKLRAEFSGFDSEDFALFAAILIS